MVRIERDIKAEYLGFLYDIVRDSNHEDYRQLLDRLHSIPFVPILDMDSNRCSDGVGLRLYFCSTYKYDEIEAERSLGGPCSVLELMVGLAKRMEDDIMWDPDYGDRTSVWFWQMVDNLGLSGCNDDNYDAETDEKVCYIIDNFIGRRYFKDGYGGLFPLKNAKQDQRKVEIWYQMQAFLLEHDD